jgi:hypothetical protein
MNDQLIKIDKEQKLYILSAGKNHISCLGFEVVMKRVKALAEEMSEKFYAKRLGTKKMYKELSRLTEIARRKNIRTGWRSQSELYKPFIYNEGRRVEVEYNWGEKERFIIGKSTGWIPCHIMLKRIDSHGGGGVLNSSIKSYRFIG